MTYLSIKALHIVAAIIWVGGLFMLTFVSGKAHMTPAQMQRASRVTDAAIGATWLLGIVLVVVGSWYSSKWWYIKLLLVVIISAIHSIVHRRWKSENEVKINDAIAPAVIVLTILVVFLAVFKRPL